VELRVAQIWWRSVSPRRTSFYGWKLIWDMRSGRSWRGLRQYYEPEKLIGRKVVIVANRRRGRCVDWESRGMVVAASVGDEGAPVLAGFLEDVPVGARLR